jgi:hypothetical protein
VGEARGRVGGTDGTGRAIDTPTTPHASTAASPLPDKTNVLRETPSVIPLPQSIRRSAESTRGMAPSLSGRGHPFCYPALTRAGAGA